MRVLVGGVGYRWQRDASLGLHVSDALAREDLGPDVEVRDLGYGALMVAADLAGVPPYDRIVLVAAATRGREPGRIARRRWTPKTADPVEIQERVREAGAGIIDVDHLLVLVEHFATLPEDVVVIEVEPFDVGPDEAPTPQGAAILPRLIEMAREEARAAAAFRSPVSG